MRLKPGGAVEVDDFSKTSADTIWAVGDVTDRINLTPVAIREGSAFAETVFHGRPTAFDHACVPTSVFSQPPVGVVGMTEAEARHAHRKVDIYRARFRPMKNMLADNPERVLMKLVVDGETDRVLGCHIVGPEGPELIQLAAIAVKAGLTKAQWGRDLRPPPHRRRGACDDAREIRATRTAGGAVKAQGRLGAPA